MIGIHSQLSSINKFKDSVWILGILTCLFGVADRAVTVVLDICRGTHVSYLEFSYFLGTTLLLMGWLCLKPTLEEEFNVFERLESGKLNSNLYRNQSHLIVARNRMLELRNQHVISQLHTLPFPYLSQIYHLLNLKHLETVHSSSLGNLKVVDVCNIQPTPLGGTVQFKTTLTSSLNILKIWRQSIVDVELTLHTPYMIELNIPVYGGKRMIVMFNIFPLSSTSHELLIDIYTDLPYPRFLLLAVLHIASLFTLYEDLPYLKKLSERGLENLLTSNKAASNKASGNKAMWLFERFVNLHSSEAHFSEAT
jgi:hypothetical protein